MKDVQGIQRGKCNSCECIEYRTPEESGKYSCGYCGHRPVDHVRIIELGGCRAKDCDCDKYSSDDPNSYTDCQYCGCSASVHEGAEALRKSRPTPSQPPPTATVPVSAVTGGFFTMSGHPGVPHTTMQQYSPSGIQPRLSSQGVPVQSIVHGTCSRPGCQFPKRLEGAKVHDYCSKTCAQKHSQSFHQQKIACAQQAAKSGQVGPPPPGAMPQMGGSGMQQSKPMCKMCNQTAANPGRAWCENCYQQSQKP